MKRNFFNMIKYLYLEPRSRITFHGEILEIFPINSERSKDITLPNIVQEDLTVQDKKKET